MLIMQALPLLRQAFCSIKKNCKALFYYQSYFFSECYVYLLLYKRSLFARMFNRKKNVRGEGGGVLLKFSRWNWCSNKTINDPVK